MAKIVIEIDGKDAIVKIDGKEVDNLASFIVDFYKYDCRCDGTPDTWMNFSYSVKDFDNKEFPSLTTYYYEPAKACFGEGKKTVDTKHPTKGDFERM